MPSGKRQTKPHTVRDIASSRRSAGKSVEGFRSNIVASANENRNSVPDGAEMEIVEPCTEIEPDAITTRKPVLSSAAFTGSELLCQLERMLSTSDNELFTFAVLAYDLGIPMAVKMLGAAHSLDAEQATSPRKD